MQSKRSVGSGSGRGGDRSSGRGAAARPPAARPTFSGAGGDGRDAIARTADALGYELVDVERLAGGLLRVTIDRIPGRVYPGAAGAEATVTVDDCEAMTRQLQYLLEVEGVDYGRLEVSSPGLDRPLKRASDWARFRGEAVEITLHEPFDGRKRWRGVLAEAEPGAPAGSWRLELRDEPGAKPAAPGARGRPRRAGAASRAPADAAPARALDFTLDEVREARLVPVIDFKGRRGVADDAAPPPPAAEPAAIQNKTATE